MHLPGLTAVLALLALSITTLALPAPASATDAIAAAARCEYQLARCVSLRNSFWHCRAIVCNEYGDECKPCRAEAVPSLSTSTSTLTSTTMSQTKREADIKHPRNNCILICSHVTCDLLCSNPGFPPSAAAGTVDTEVADTDAAATITDDAAADPTIDTENRVTVPLPLNGTTLIAPMGLSSTSPESSKGEKCIYLCTTSGEDNNNNAKCQRSCWAPEIQTDTTTHSTDEDETTHAAEIQNCTLHSPNPTAAQEQSWLSCPLPRSSVSVSTSRIRLKPKSPSSSKPGFFFDPGAQCEVGGGIVPRVRCWGV